MDLPQPTCPTTATSAPFLTLMLTLRRKTGKKPPGCSRIIYQTTRISYPMKGPPAGGLGLGLNCAVHPQDRLLTLELQGLFVLSEPRRQLSTALASKFPSVPQLVDASQQPAVSAPLTPDPFNLHPPTPNPPPTPPFNLPPGGNPIYKPYRYVPPQRVPFSSISGLKLGNRFCHFGLK